ncbi:MAG: hypothetical protein LC746_02730 [Acidobacteria bacterium]|nr:hypothetical protein [Acidobacteriota bacterium]
MLDLDEDADTYVPQRAAQAAPSNAVRTARAVATAYEEKTAYTDATSYSDEPAYQDETPAAVEMQSAGSVSMAEPSVAWVAAEELAVSPEPVAAHAQESGEAGAPVVSDETDRATRDAQEPEAQTSRRSETQPGAVELSSEAIDAIARRVVEQLSERVVREIAWEVVPDLAERLIRQKLEEERARQ